MNMLLYASLMIMSVYAFGGCPYILCIDGGGSKTALQVIDPKGLTLPLTKNGVTTYQVEATGSNVNGIGVDGVRQSLINLFDNVIVDNDKILRDILPMSCVVAGMAGCGAGNNKNVIIHIFEELGVQSDRLLLASDAVLALKLVHDDGAILIAGTGSICLGKKGDANYRVGGLGYLLGDEGSGYFIGLQALKVALADEYGWGKQTTLTSVLCALYEVPELKNVMQDLYKHKITPTQIACTAPLVISQAIARDAQAIEIINNAANQLCNLVVTMIAMADLCDCDIHLWGGLFKSEASALFVKTIAEHPSMRQNRINLVNQARHNAATLFAQQNICAYAWSPSTWQSAKNLLAV